MIGPAGENLVRFACVENNKWHSLGRGGIGCVFGSKKLKGLVFHGDRKVEVGALPTPSRRSSRTWPRAARTTPAWPPTGAAARSTWCGC